MGNRAENEIEAYLPFWKQLSQPQQEKILREAVLKTAKKGEIIHRGNADCLGFVIVKCGQLRAFVTSGEGKEIDLAVPIPNFIAGVIMVSNAWKTLQLSTEPFIIAGYVFYIILGVVMLYSILLLPPLLSFWFVKSEGISQIVSGLSNFNMMPMAIYPKALKFFGTFIIPIFIVSNFPPLFVLGRLNIGTQIWGIVAPILFFGGARIVFKKAIRKYSSIAN